jgi:hypothetical protein
MTKKVVQKDVPNARHCTIHQFHRVPRESSALPLCIPAVLLGKSHAAKVRSLSLQKLHRLQEAVL